MMRIMLIVFIISISFVSYSGGQVEYDAPTDKNLQPTDNTKPDKQAQQFEGVIDNTEWGNEIIIKKTGDTARLVGNAWKSKAATEIALALSSILFLVLGAIRRIYGDRVRGNTIRLACIIAGAIASLLGYYGGGFGVIESLQLFMGGVGAIAINESIKVTKKKGVVNANPSV